MNKIKSLPPHHDTSEPLLDIEAAALVILIVLWLILPIPLALMLLFE
ncbi:MAG: hypothetical protein WBA42_01345 [Mesorhizobium sp.]